jgi:hypothetical protein
MGIITVMADLLGYEAYGIEIAGRLVQSAREITVRYGSSARFAAGSFLPQGWEWRPRDGDGRLGTIGEGTSGYQGLGLPLGEFGLVYGYPSSGKEAMMLDSFRAHEASDGRHLLHLCSGESHLMRRGRIERTRPHAGDPGHLAP